MSATWVPRKEGLLHRAVGRISQQSEDIRARRWENTDPETWKDGRERRRLPRNLERQTRQGFLIVWLYRKLGAT